VAREKKKERKKENKLSAKYNGSLALATIQRATITSASASSIAAVFKGSCDPDHAPLVP